MTAAAPECQGLDIGTHRLPCPVCDKGQHDKALKVTVEAEGAIWYCHRCQSSGYSRDSSYRRVTRPALIQTPAQHLTLASHWCDVWRDLRPIADTPCAHYLQARGCALPPHDADIRFGVLRHPSGYVGPCMVALVTDAITREPITLHRTWIRPDGQKAAIESPRLLLGKHRKKGGVIRLWPDEAVTTGLAVAEGIETALTVAHAFEPVWSLIDAGNMAAFPVLAGIESLLIVADHDQAGLRAADECAERWCLAGKEVRICKSPVPGEDLNDFARAV